MMANLRAAQALRDAVEYLHEMKPADPWAQSCPSELGSLSTGSQGFVDLLLTETGHTFVISHYGKRYRVSVTPEGTI